MFAGVALINGQIDSTSAVDKRGNKCLAQAQASANTINVR
jgi:hypothetical protein